MDQTCVFCKIIANQIPSSKIWEDDKYIAFLTINPINPGHTLVIPKQHIPYLFDLKDEDLGNMMVVAKQIAQALKIAFNPSTGRVGVMVAGLEVPHAHIHLIPLNSELDLNFEKAKPDVSTQELQAHAQRIRDELKTAPLPQTPTTTGVNLIDEGK